MQGLLVFTGVMSPVKDDAVPFAAEPGPKAGGPPGGMREILVFEHTADVQVQAHQRLVERLDLIMEDGDVRRLDIPGEPGEAFDEARFSQRRQEALNRLVGDGPPPGVLSRQYVLWQPEGEA